MDMLANTLTVITLQNITLSTHQVVHLKFMQLYVNYISILNKRNRSLFPLLSVALIVNGKKLEKKT